MDRCIAEGEFSCSFVLYFFKQTPSQMFCSQRCRMTRCQLKNRDGNAASCIPVNCLFGPLIFSRDGKNLTKKRGTQLVSHANRNTEDEIREKYRLYRPRYSNIDLYREFRMATVTSNLRSIQDMPFDGSFALLANPEVYICYVNAVIHSLCRFFPGSASLGTAGVFKH